VKSSVDCVLYGIIYTFLSCPADDSDEFRLVDTSSVHVIQTDFLFHRDPCCSIEFVRKQSASKTATNSPLGCLVVQCFCGPFCLC